MAEKYLNDIGLKYYHDRVAKVKFADKTEFTTLQTRVEGIANEGGEPNKIDVIKVNGTVQIITEKAVDLQVPMVQNTATSIKINDGAETQGILFIETENGYQVSGLGDTTPSTKELVDKDYVDANGGKIDKIKVNGTEQTITNKAVDLKAVQAKGTYNEGVLQQLELAQGGEGVTFFPTDNGIMTFLSNEGATVQEELVSKDYTDSTFRTEAQVNEAITAALADITGIDFQIVTELPATGEKGVIYLIAAGTDSYDEYIYVNNKFELLGTTKVDLSDYVKKSDITTISTAEIDALFEE